MLKGGKGAPFPVMDAKHGIISPTIIMIVNH